VSETLRRNLNLVQARDILISAHGYDEMAEDSILAAGLIAGVAAAVVVEDYPRVSEGTVYSCPPTGPER
jgi:hypothetical protein